MKTVSLITTSFNAVSYIKQTIDSVISQPGDFKIEYILQDALSTDGTWEIIQQFAQEYKHDKRISVIIESAKDGGMYAGINKGLSKMTGSIWGYLNADDILMPGALRNVVEYFETHEATEMIYGQGLYINEQGKFFGLYPSFDLNEVPLVDNCYISQPSVFLRKNIYQKLGGFNSLIKNSGDYEYWLRVQSLNHKIDFIPDVLSATRIHQNTKTNSNRAKIQLETMAIASHYNKQVVPLRWKKEFGRENSNLTRFFDLMGQVMFKIRDGISNLTARFFLVGKSRDINELRKRLFSDK